MQLMVSHVDQNTCSASYVGLPLVSLSPNPYLTSPHNLHLTQRPLSFERKLGLLRQPRLASHKKCQHYLANCSLVFAFAGVVWTTSSGGCQNNWSRLRIVCTPLLCLHVDADVFRDCPVSRQRSLFVNLSVAQFTKGINPIINEFKIITIHSIH